MYTNRDFPCHNFEFMNFIILKSALKTEIGQGGVYQPPLNFGEADFFWQMPSNLA